MNNFYVYANGDTLFVTKQQSEELAEPVYSSIDNVEASVKLGIRRIVADETSLGLIDTWTDGAVFRYITDYPHLERIELYCSEQDIKNDRFRGNYTHKLPALIVHDKSDSNYGNGHRDPTCNAFSQPFGDIRIRFYFSTCDVDIVYDNGTHAEVIPFPGNDQAVWSADFALIADRSLSLFGDYAEGMFSTLGTLNDQLRYAVRIVKLYPDRSSFYKNTIIKNAQRAAILSIWQNNSEDLLFVLNLIPKITLGEIGRLMETAQASHATSCTALLLNYKNTHFTSEEIDEYETELFFLESDNITIFDPLINQDYSFLDQKDGTLGIAGYNGADTNIVIPTFAGKKQVSTICGEAFRECVNLSRIVIPEGITEIGTRAFYGCSNLSNVVVPQSAVTIGNDVFGGCTSLADKDGFIVIDDVLYAYIGNETDVIVPKNVKEIYNRAFSGSLQGAIGCVTNVTLPESLKKIGSYAFNGCSSLLNIVFPDTLSEIGEHAFSGCTSLKKLSLPLGITELSPGIFKGCSNLETVLIPSSVTNIRLGAFEGCKNLADISIPDSVKKIGDFAFKKCINIKEVIIPNSVELKYCDSIFENCESLRSVTLPASCKEIGRNWFSGCFSLRSITIPDGVIRIGFSAFSDCNNLKSITLPDSVVQIAANAFKNCSKLAMLSLPNGISSISTNTFSFCSSLKEVILPAACSSIAANAFSGCYSLNNIIIPSACLSVSDHAFAGCTELITAVIPATCQKIGQQAFERCNNLTIHTTKGAYAEKYAEENGIPYVLNA